ncbi:hypothetical protein BL250_17690 [Erwinia sp. OLTSP20]|uniref:winged helix-turn-helix domain-containing protein n=1 Tax=unclassified Erwinia TaxID=2622719 RepID=UPI000C1779C6|nr:MULTISPECIES: winged helix-turn-helix domain-containing protein [unclassified Erwinia]PIJ48300.1 hypothetical protein BV501_17735 [Erwinia sp. OAMSP11]PIJ71621.1 hypothetical protein BK416_11445 [Erwinia sp. OLSSP12]PIJ82691.1 hypothetical protein BLD47_06210 [Erwinia sp. OLCASP19]PIJ83158.1 hypothetical protein BLD46_10305 [Erwinia sp. OLMTSP26]PIJ85324.1 hypothetical protein BLD49_10865 [Erwinia sp. OLMDSP33]
MSVRINNEVEFDQDKKILKSDLASYEISTPASYCLMLLLEKRDQLVSHEELYECAWRRFGMEVTANTLYQNISELRKALKSCGIQEKIIQTIPRRGFSLLSDNQGEAESKADNPFLVEEKRAGKVNKTDISNKLPWNRYNYLILMIIMINLILTLSLFITY